MSSMMQWKILAAHKRGKKDEDLIGWIIVLGLAVAIGLALALNA